MSKIAMITDIHFGCWKNSDIFLNGTTYFIEREFIPYCEKNGIDHVIIPGDVFDNRTTLNVKTITIAKTNIRKIAEVVPVTIITGNHDLYFTNTYEVHSLEIFDGIPNVTLVDSEVSTMIIPDIFGNTKKIVMVPWIIDSEAFAKEIADGGDVLIGHFDITGFKMNNDVISEHGHDINLFTKFKKVFSGHFHTRSTKNIGNTEIVYIGSPCQITRADYGDERGFTILDTDTLEWEFVANTISPKYVKLTYPEKFKCTSITNNFVDVTIDYSIESDDKKIEKYLDIIEGCGPAEKPKVHFLSADKKETDVALNIDDVSSMDKLFVEYIHKTETVKRKDAVLEKLLSVYKIVSN